jgi:hypothetical protein
MNDLNCRLAAKSTNFGNPTKLAPTVAFMYSLNSSNSPIALPTANERSLGNTCSLALSAWHWSNRILATKPAARTYFDFFLSAGLRQRYWSSKEGEISRRAESANLRACNNSGRMIVSIVSASRLSSSPDKFFAACAIRHVTNTVANAATAATNVPMALAIAQPSGALSADTTATANSPNVAPAGTTSKCDGVLGMSRQVHPNTKPATRAAKTRPTQKPVNRQSLNLISFTNSVRSVNLSRADRTARLRLRHPQPNS